MLKIVTVPNKILTTAAQPVTRIDEKVKKLIARMEKTLLAQKDPQGVGLAAPQVGVNLAIFITKPTAKAKVKAFINPKILKMIQEEKQAKVSPKNSSSVEKIKKKSKIKTKLEGCLSIPKIWGPVKRAGKILLAYQTLEGEKKQEWFSGFEAVIIQHEVDHLNGILFTQRALEQNSSLYEEENGKLKKLNY